MKIDPLLELYITAKVKPNQHSDHLWVQSVLCGSVRPLHELDELEVIKDNETPQKPLESAKFNF